MTNKEYQHRLSQQFGHLDTRLRQFNSAGRNTFIPVFADILPKILDLLLNTHLEETHHLSRESFFVGDEERKIAAEIRITLDNAEIPKMLKLFVDQGLDRKYDRLIVLVLKIEPYVNWDKLSASFFNPLEDLWSLQTLFANASALSDPQDMACICAYLDKLLDVSFDRPRYCLPSVPPYSDTFVGREKELNELRHRLLRKKPIFISGIGGIGKTEVALRMAACYAPPKGAYFIRYNNFADQNQEIIRQVILSAEFGNYRYEGQDNDTHDREYAQRLEILRTQYKDALLIVDNFDLSQKTMQDVCQEASYRDLTETGVHLVFTTRYDDIQDSVVISRLESRELRNFMRSLYPNPKVTDDQLNRLIEAVEGHTQTVELMARTMSRSWGRIGPQNFLDAFEKNNLNHGRYPTVSTVRGGEIFQQDIYVRSRTVFYVSDLSNLDRRILLYATLLPVNGIRKELFRLAIADCGNEDITSIINRGWLRRNKQSGDIISIHPVIRAVCWGELKPSDDNCRDFLDELWLQSVKARYNEQQINQLADLFATATNRLNNLDGIWSLRTGLFLEQLCKYSEALSYFLKTAKKQEALKPNSKDLVRTYNKIGGTYLNLSKPADALEYFQKALLIAEKNSAMSEDLLATTYNNMGHTYSDLGNFTHALEYGLQALKIRKACYSGNHLALAASYNNVGSAYFSLGDYAQALKYKLHALAIREKVLPPENLDLAKSYHNVGTIYMHLGDHPKALEFLLKALWIREQVLPHDHTSLATSYNNVGCIYMRLGNHPKALEFLLKALGIREQVLPHNHLDLANSYNNVGGAYMRLGDHPKALEFLLKALHIREMVLPQDHPDIAESCSNTAVIFCLVEDYPDAIAYSHRAAEIAKKVLPPDHPDQQFYRQLAASIQAKAEM